MSAIHKSGRLGALGAVILGLAACGGSTSSAPIPPGVVPQGGSTSVQGGATTSTQGGATTSVPLACDLITNQEAAAFFGADGAAVKKVGRAFSAPAMGSNCAVEDGQRRKLDITVELNNPNYPNQDGIHDVSGIGDRARWRGGPDGTNPNAFEIIKRTTQLTIVVSDNSGTFNWTLDSLTAVAKAAAGRL